MAENWLLAGYTGSGLDGNFHAGADDLYVMKLSPQAPTSDLRLASLEQTVDAPRKKKSKRWTCELWVREMVCPLNMVVQTEVSKEYQLFERLGNGAIASVRQVSCESKHGEQTH